MKTDVAWVADELPRLHVAHEGFDWPVNGLDPFALDHEETAYLLWARRTPSRAYLGPLSDDEHRGIDRVIPMGYTTLAEFEKVAVASAGELLRVWPHGQRDTYRADLQPYQLIVPPAGRGYQNLGALWPFRYALGDAVGLSERTNGPVLLGRVLSHVNWH